MILAQEQKHCKGFIDNKCHQYLQITLSERFKSASCLIRAITTSQSLTALLCPSLRAAIWLSQYCCLSLIWLFLMFFSSCGISAIFFLKLAVTSKIKQWNSGILIQSFNKEPCYLPARCFSPLSLSLVISSLCFCWDERNKQYLQVDTKISLAVKSSL